MLDRGAAPLVITRIFPPSNICKMIDQTESTVNPLPDIPLSSGNFVQEGAVVKGIGRLFISVVSLDKNHPWPVVEMATT